METSDSILWALRSEHHPVGKTERGKMTNGKKLGLKTPSHPVRSNNRQFPRSATKKKHVRQESLSQEEDD